jgi:hypothetical protein
LKRTDAWWIGPSFIESTKERRSRRTAVRPRHHHPLEDVGEGGFDVVPILDATLQQGSKNVFRELATPAALINDGTIHHPAKGCFQVWICRSVDQPFQFIFESPLVSIENGRCHGWVSDLKEGQPFQESLHEVFSKTEHFSAQESRTALRL